MLKKMMSCRDVALRLQTYLDGELDEARMERISAHLDACADCGLEADVFTSIKKELAQCSQPVSAEAIARLREFSEQIARTASQETEPPTH